MNDPAAKDKEQPADSTPIAKQVEKAPRLQFVHSYSFVFESPNWAMNLLLATVCMFIPAIGPIIVAGYQWDVVESMHRFPKARYPDFDFNRFVEYLVRGVWPFLLNMLTSFIQVPLNLIAIYGGMGLVALAASSAPSDEEGLYVAATATVVVPVALFIMIGIPVLIHSITMPLILKASLTQEPKGMVDFKFLVGFLKLTWREMILEQIWMAVTGPVLFVIGLLLCFIGIYPAIALWMLADAHTNWQIYEIYLSRGGEPVKLKPLKPAPMPTGPAPQDMPAYHDPAATPPQRQLPLIEPEIWDADTGTGEDAPREP